MVANKPQVVIIGAGMAGLTAARKLYTSPAFLDHFDLCVVEGGTRIGGRINTAEFDGDQIELGATWIHGIGNSPVYKIAQDINSLDSEQPWECMDGFLDDPTTIAEGGYELNPTMVENISHVFKKLMDFAQGKLGEEETEWHKLGAKACARTNGEMDSKTSVGCFLKRGLEAYWESVVDAGEDVEGCGNWSRKMIHEAIFALHANTQRTYTSAGDLCTLDFCAESEYQMFPGEEITIAKGYLSIINSLAAVLPSSIVQLGRRVSKIDWKQDEMGKDDENGNGEKPVKIYFGDGSVLFADHVIITVSLGVLKDGIRGKFGMFNPPLPLNKADAISRLGYGTVNKLFLRMNSIQGSYDDSEMKFPFLQMAFHRQDSDLKDNRIPWWMRRTTSLSPLHKKSTVLLGWFAGDEAIALETLDNEKILNGVSTTVSSFLTLKSTGAKSQNTSAVQFNKVLTTKWGSDPLFLGSYSYIAVGSSGDDLDKLAEPLPEITGSNKSRPPQLQLLFAGEATHRTHYSTTHGAYFSGLREANRLLQHYNMVGI